MQPTKLIGIGCASDCCALAKEELRVKNEESDRSERNIKLGVVRKEGTEKVLTFQVAPSTD